MFGGSGASEIDNSDALTLRSGRGVAGEVSQGPRLSGTWSYGYDGRDQLTGEQVQRSDAAKNLARTWGYDAAGNPEADSSRPASAAAST